MKQVTFWRRGSYRFSVEPYNSVRDGTGGEAEGEGEEGRRKRQTREHGSHMMLHRPSREIICPHLRRALHPKVESTRCEGGRNFLCLSKILLAELRIEVTWDRLTEEHEIWFCMYEESAQIWKFKDRQNAIYMSCWSKERGRGLGIWRGGRPLAGTWKEMFRKQNFSYFADRLPK